MRSLLLCGGFLTLTAVLGCSSDMNPYSTSQNPVSGKVLASSGEPIRGGAEIILTPKAKENGIFGKEGSAQIDATGKFSLKTSDGEDGIPGGFYTVVIRPYGAANSPAKQAASRSIPKKFWSEDTSDLTVEIDGEKSGWDIRLTK